MTRLHLTRNVGANWPPQRGSINKFYIKKDTIQSNPGSFVSTAGVRCVFGLRPKTGRQIAEISRQISVTDGTE
jgi:hypothetical protein